MTTLHTLTRCSRVPTTVLDAPSGARPWIIRAVDLDRDKSDPDNPRVRSGTMIQLAVSDRAIATLLLVALSFLFDNVTLYRRGGNGKLVRVFL